MKQSLLAYTFVTCLFACGQDRGVNQAFGQHKSQVGVLTDTSQLAASDGASAPTAADDERCREAAIEQLPMVAKGDTLVISGMLDLGACLAGELAAPDAEVLSAQDRQQVYLTIRCEGVDLSAWHGKAYGGLAQQNVHPCAQATKAQMFSQTDDRQLTRIRRRTEGGPVITEVGRRVLRLDSNKDGGPCTYLVQEGRLTGVDCIASHRSTITRSRIEVNGRIFVQPEEGREETQRSSDTPREAH